MKPYRCVRNKTAIAERMGRFDPKNLTDLTLITRIYIISLWQYFIFMFLHIDTSYYSFIYFTVRKCKDYISNYKATSYSLTLSPYTSIFDL